jgi:uncharacterized protein
VLYIHFSWDDLKDRLNRKKHDVSFEEARTVFFDPAAKLIHDPEHSEREDRFIMLGLSRRLRLLVVHHTYDPSEEIIRIISARKASLKEARAYEGT